MPIPAGEDNQADPDTRPRQQRMQYSQQHQIPQGQSEQLLLQQQRQEEDTSSPSARQQKVAQFLTDCNLLQYYPLFIAEGFDQIEAVSLDYSRSNPQANKKYTDCVLEGIWSDGIGSNTDGCQTRSSPGMQSNNAGCDELLCSSQYCNSTQLLQRAIANARGFTSTPPVYVHSTPYGTLASPGNGKH